MTLFSSILLFILGAAIGSFLNVIAYRSAHGGSIFFGSSKCPHCKHKLAAIDLIPIVSYLVQNGKCRYCGKPISLQYPLVETATGILFAFTFYYWTNLNLINSINLVNLFYLLFVVSTLIVLFVTDLRDGLLPNSVVLPAIGAVAVYKGFFAIYNSYNGYNGYTSFPIDFLVALLVAGVFFAIVWVSGERVMGGGDPKLVLFIGVAVGWQGLVVALFASFLTGALAAVTLILIGKKRFGQTIPFGPFLSLGALLALFWGQELIVFYLRVLSG